MNFISLSSHSIRLSRLLDNIIGTDQAVDIRRKVNAMSWYIRDVEVQSVIYSGSRGEGLSFDSSDYDLMSVDRDTKVFNRRSDITIEHQNATLLMIRDECHPGFVILELLNETKNPKIQNSLLQRNGMTVLSSELYKSSFIFPKYPHYDQGPVTTYTLIKTEVDVASCFRCPIWPNEANDFILRNRPYAWPSHELIDKIVQTGCHVVPIGDKTSDIQTIQWRLSFSVAEKMLVHSLSHVQLKVYGLLKIVLKELINTRESLKGLLCSYFLKTAVFYAVESTAKSFWRENLLIECFWFCFNKLMKWVEEGNCPNYFVPENNMFRCKIRGEYQQRLHRFLLNCKKAGWKCLFQCKSLQALKYSGQNNSTECSYLLSSELTSEVNFDITFMDEISTLARWFFGPQQNAAIARNLFTLFRNVRTVPEEDICRLLFRAVCRSMALCYICKESTQQRNAGNKTMYQLLRKSERMLLQFADLDVSTGPLTLATLYYKIGKYETAIHVCEHLFTQWKPFVLYGEGDSIVCLDYYEKYICGLCLLPSQKVKKTFAQTFCFRSDEIELFPRDLHYDASAVSPNFVHIPPLPYALFLLFLCNYKLGNIEKSMAALKDLRVLVKDNDQGFRQRPIVLNLLAICLEKIGDVDSAAAVCAESNKLKPEKNGASEILSAINLRCQQ